MTNNEAPYGSMDEETQQSQIVPESPEAIDDFAEPLPQYPIHLANEFEIGERGDAEAADDHNTWTQEVRQVVDAPEPVVLPMAILDTPDGYTAPEFETSASEVAQDLDALFAEIAETSIGQSAEVAVWCPWLATA